MGCVMIRKLELQLQTKRRTPLPGKRHILTDRPVETRGKSAFREPPFIAEDMSCQRTSFLSCPHVHLTIRCTCAQSSGLNATCLACLLLMVRLQEMWPLVLCGSAMDLYVIVVLQVATSDNIKPP